MLEVLDQFAKIKFETEYDIIVAIGRGGIVPAGMIASILDLPVSVLNLRRRDDEQNVVFEIPKVIGEVLKVDGLRVLLVDDVLKTGSTFKRAKELLSSAKLVDTFVVNGLADYSLYDEDCFWLPWRVK